MTELGKTGRSSASHQVNVTLDSHWHLVLRQAALADDKSVPDLLRPVVLAYLKRRLKNEDLAEAVARMEKIARDRAKAPDNVTEMPVEARRRPRRPSAEPGATG